MHDPMVVAFDIPRPWPKINRNERPHDRRIEVRYSWRRWYNIHPKVFRKFWRFGNIELYWPAIITVWHVEPGGHDALTICRHRIATQRDNEPKTYRSTTGWRWHVHHWKIQVRPLQHFRRWALTRCEWCGGRSRKGDMVNHSLSWDRDGGSWWRGERGLFHDDCSSIYSAHKSCTCSIAVPEHGDYGRCAVCGLFRVWRSKDEAPSPRLESNLILKSIPEGQRDPAKQAEVRTLWKAHRASTTEATQ